MPLSGTIRSTYNGGTPRVSGRFRDPRRSDVRPAALCDPRQIRYPKTWYGAGPGSIDRVLLGGAVGRRIGWDPDGRGNRLGVLRVAV